MISKRVPILRYDSDGSVHEGTAALSVEQGSYSAHDFRDMNGEKMSLPGHSRFEIPLPLDDAQD